MVCAPCPTGTWSDGGAYSTTLCERCPTGSTTAGPTSESKDDCNICQSGFAGDPDAGEPCKLCPAGTYADPDDNAECTPCPEDDDGNPTTTPKAGAVEEDQCYIAVCDEGYQSVKGKCYECAEGWTSDKVRQLCFFSAEDDFVVFSRFFPPGKKNNAAPRRFAETKPLTPTPTPTT